MQEKYPKKGYFWLTGAKSLFDECEFVLATLDEGEFVDRGVSGDFFAINRDSITFEELAAFAFTGGETGLDENIEELGAFGGGREAFGK